MFFTDECLKLEARPCSHRERQSHGQDRSGGIFEGFPARNRNKALSRNPAAQILDYSPSDSKARIIVPSIQ